MDEHITLGELARRSRRGKTTLKNMIQDGSLIGQRKAGGHGEYEIPVDSAIAAGLLPSQSDEVPVGVSIDDAVRLLVDEAMVPLFGAISRVQSDVGLDAIVVLLERVDTKLATVCTALADFEHARRRNWLRRLAGALLGR